MLRNSLKSKTQRTEVKLVKTGKYFKTLKKLERCVLANKQENSTRHGSYQAELEDRRSRSRELVAMDFLPNTNEARQGSEGNEGFI